MVARKLSTDERSRIAEKIMEMGNLMLAALGVGQILSGRVDWIAAVGGIAAFALAYFVAYEIMKRG